MHIHHWHAILKKIHGKLKKKGTNTRGKKLMLMSFYEGDIRIRQTFVNTKEV